MTYATWATQFTQSVKGLGYDKSLTLYSLRHGGASHEALVRNAAAGTLKSKGRWRDDRSVKRYAKGGRVNQVLAALSRTQQRDACRARKSLGEFLLKTYLQ